MYNYAYSDDSKRPVALFCFKVGVKFNMSI